jgi:hypothetical protein
VKGDKYDKLSVLVIENELISTPTRLVTVLESIIEIYEVVSDIGDKPSTDLSVVSCDSGSDKAFDFLGLAKTIQEVKEIILGVWDKIIFYKENKVGKNIELIVKALPAIDKIGDMEKKKTISPEKAELLRRKLISGVTKFVDSGSIIPEINDRTYYNPRELMAPQHKMLTSSGFVMVSEGPLEHNEPIIREDNEIDVESEGSLDGIISELLLNPAFQEKILKIQSKRKVSKATIKKNLV